MRVNHNAVATNRMVAPTEASKGPAVEKYSEAEAEDRAVVLLSEHQSRQMEALRCYRPLPSQLRFHASNASQRIIRGGNRGGKTIPSVAEFASIVMQEPIIGPDGSPLPLKTLHGKPPIAWVIGYDERHIGETLHRLLFQPGAFRVIRDETTGAWRCYRPWDPQDTKRSKEAQPAAPFIPVRAIEENSWGWRSKRQEIFTGVVLKNGTRIFAYPSTARKAKQGDPCDLVWIDEDVANAKHIAEFEARLSDRKGRIMWSAYPHSSNDALVKMSMQAEEQKNLPEPDVEEIVVRYSDNPFIDEDEKRKRIDSWDHNERRARDFGEFLYDSVLMYPEFHTAIHGCPKERKGEWDEIDRVVASGTIPNTWTRYLSLDPGHTRCAVLFAAVPPPELGDHVLIENEIVVERHDAHGLAKKVLQFVKGKNYQSFVMDFRAGRQTPMGYDKTVKQHYMEAFRVRGIRSEQTGHDFIDGTDNQSARSAEVRSWLRIREQGGPKFRIIFDRCPHLIREFYLYKKRILQDEVTDEPIRKNCDACHALEYLAGLQPTYVPPGARRDVAHGAYAVWQKLDAQRKKQETSDHINLGPPTAAAMN